MSTKSVWDRSNTYYGLMQNMGLKLPMKVDLKLFLKILPKCSLQFKYIIHDRKEN